MNPPTDVLVVSENGSVSGGAEFVAISSALLLAERGIRVRFLAGSTPVDPRLEAAGIAVHSVDAPRDARARIWGAKHVPLADAALADLDPQTSIVHLHGGLGHLGPAVYGRLLDSGIPVVATLHDYGLACPNSGFYIFPTGEKCPHRPLSLGCVTTQCSKSGPKSKAALVLRTTLLTRRVRPLRRLAAIARLGERNGSLIIPYADAAIPVLTVENPFADAREPAVDVAANAPIVSIGRLVPEKDPVGLAAAARRTGLPIVFVGDGPLEKEVMEANPDATVTGWQNREGVLAHLRSARAHAMASRWWEGSPMSITDALALGVPNVVPSEMSGAERIDPGVTGLHFSLNDPATLDTALRTIADPSTASRLGRAGYDRFWADPPDGDRHVRDLFRLYEAARSRKAS